MRRSRGLSAIGVLAVLIVSAGCGAGDETNPVWDAFCEAICVKSEECFQVPTDACVSLCLSEFGQVRCKGNQAAVDMCVEDIGGLSCSDIERGLLPGSCDDICLCERADDCDDGNECTAGMCDVESGACSFTTVPDRVPCVGDAGTCKGGRCVMACTEAGIRSAVVEGGGPYAFACDGSTTVTTQGEIVIEKDLILDGGGNLTIDADGRHRVFSVSSELYFPIVELHNLTITGGNVQDRGGGIRNSGMLTLSNSSVVENTASRGGGISNHGGELMVVDSIVSENAAQVEGGGIDNGDTLTIINSIISDNAAPRGGGVHTYATATLLDTAIARNTAMGSAEPGEAPSAGIYNAYNLTVIGSTVSENVAGPHGGVAGIPSFDGEGAGIYNSYNLTMIGSTVSENVAGLRGGVAGIASFGGGELTMMNSTVSGNQGAALYITASGTVISSTFSGNAAEYSGGIVNDGQLTLRNTLIDDQCNGQSPISGGGNVESPSDTCGLDDPTDQVNVSVEQLNLGPLQDNGGPTLTHLPGPGSAAIDVIDPEDCVDADGQPLRTDQRAIQRPQGLSCDVGAVEVVP